MNSRSEAVTGSVAIQHPMGELFVQQFITLIETSASDLISYEGREALPATLEIYRLALLAFYRGDVNEMQSLLTSPQLKEGSASQSEVDTRAEALISLNSTSNIGKQLKFCIKLRLSILVGKVEKSDLDQVESFLGSESLFLGEGLLIAAAGFEILNDFQKARETYLLATRELKRIGADKKSLLAQVNAAINLTHLEPGRIMLPELVHLFRKARQLNEQLIAATMLLNISREYQKMGAQRSALKYCNRSIALSKDYAHGVTYFLAIAHRSQILFDMGRQIEALADYNFAKTSQLSQVKEAVAVLKELHGLGVAAQLSSVANSTWQERLRDFRLDPNAKLAPLGKVEEAFISYISIEPREKFQICDHLFGADLHPVVSENRLKNLIHRIRKKYPGLVVFERDHYFLAEREVGHGAEFNAG